MERYLLDEGDAKPLEEDKPETKADQSRVDEDGEVAIVRGKGVHEAEGFARAFADGEAPADERSF